MLQAQHGGLRELTVSTTMPGWLLVPEGLSGPDADRWVEQAVGELVAAWDEPLDPAGRDEVASMLRASLEARGDDPFVFDVWPLRAPFRSRVRVHALPSEGAPDWQAIGYDVTPYESAVLGPGLKCVGLGEAQVEDATGQGATIDTVEWWATFDDGAMTLAVHVESTPTLLFDRMLPGLYGLTDSLSARRADGQPFRGMDPRVVVTDPEGAWDVPEPEDSDAVQDDPKG